MKILVTGSTGFIGSALIQRLIADPLFEPIAALRRGPVEISVDYDSVVVGDLLPDTNYRDALLGVEAVIHIAGRAHVINEMADNPLDEFLQVNTVGTLNLARQAVQAGVQYFIFISSIGVNGNQNTHPFTENDTTNPVEDYAVSKLEAEQGLQKIASASTMEVVIIRPPLVYGPNAPGNFSKLMHWIQVGIPLPLGAIHNKRSLVALDNLVSFIIHCIDHPKAANEVFLISDDEDISTTELLRLVAKALGKKPRLISVPVGLMEFAAKLVGKESVTNRLFGSLQVDSSKARNLLGWRPVVTMEEQLKTTAEAWLKGRGRGS